MEDDNYVLDYFGDSDEEWLLRLPAWRFMINFLLYVRPSSILVS